MRAARLLRAGLLALRLPSLFILSGCIVLTNPGSFEEGRDSGIMADVPLADVPFDSAPDVRSACDLECEGARPFCNEASGDCVECRSPGECDTERPMCVDGSCVQCVNSDGCANADAPVCADGICVACTSATDCEGIEDGPTALPVCDLSSGTGVCVECTEANADDDCGGDSCNPATMRCTETRIGSMLDCGRCVGDGDCDMPAGFRCVPMLFDGAARPDGYCLKLESEGCVRPYGTLLTRVSLSGVSATYCGIDEASTTCDAVRALREGRDCEDGGAPNPALCADAGAVCAMVGTLSNKCSYPCGNQNDCPEFGGARTCAGDHCGS